MRGQPTAVEPFISIPICKTGWLNSSPGMNGEVAVPNVLGLGAAFQLSCSTPSRLFCFEQ